VAALFAFVPLVLFVIGISAGCYFFGKQRIIEYCLDNFGVVFGIPMSVIAFLAVIISLVSATSSDKFTIKLTSMIELSGPSVPIILWMGVFLVIVFGIYLLSDKRRSSNEHTDAHTGLGA
jgi:hypothetical protein